MRHGRYRAAPFAAILLWVRDLVRWIRGMDELHRRITLAAVLFAVSATFFFVMLWHRLEVAGFFRDLSRPQNRRQLGYLHSRSYIFADDILLFLGFGIFNRRYK